MAQGDPESPRRDAPKEALDALTEGEARRLAAAAGIEGDPALLAAGWERRFVIEKARLADCVRLYESIGFEVLAEPVLAENVMKDCTDCRIVALLDFRMIYTRRPHSA